METTKKYQTINGISFNSRTPLDLCEVLNRLINSGEVIQLFYGDINTGKQWAQECDTIGRIGRSGGSIKIPLIVPNNRRSMGGPALLDHCILKIRSKKTGLVLWQALNYINPVVEIRETLGMNEYTHETYFNGELYGRHKSLKSAQICLSKLV